MTPNKKIGLIILLGVSACVLTLSINRYFLNKEHTNQLILIRLEEVTDQIESIRLLAKDFVQRADPEVWQEIMRKMALVRSRVGSIPGVAERWPAEAGEMDRRLDAYGEILRKVHDPASKLRAERTALQGVGLSLSTAVEQEIIAPFREEEGLRVYEGTGIDPFKARIKDTAIDLNVLHIKQQLILMELMLSSDLDAYNRKKVELADALARHKAQLRYLNVLIGDSPKLQSTVLSLERKLGDLFDLERTILEHFKSLAALGGDMDHAGADLLQVGRGFSAKVVSDTLRTSRLNRTLNWSVVLGILVALSLLGAWLARDVIAFVQDLKHTQKELKESEINLVTTLYSIGDGVIATDAGGRVTRMNPTAERLTGWTAAEAAGHPLPDVFRIVNGQTRREAENPVERVLAGGEVVGLANHTVLLSRDGSEYQIADSAAPIRLGQDHLLGVVLVFRDVTETYAQQERIRENERRLKNVTDNVPGVVFQFRSTGDHVYSNLLASERAAETFDLDVRAEDFFDRFTRRLPGEERQTFIRSVRASIDRMEPWRYEGRLTSGTGEPRWFSARGVPQTEEDHVVFYGVLIDITDQKRAEEQANKLEAALSQAQKMEAIGTLAGGIAHDFNNILAAVIGYAEMGLCEAKDDSPVTRCLERILSAGMRARDLVRQILTFSRRSEREIRPLQAGPLVEEALRLLRSTLPTTIEIKQEIADRIGNVTADPTQVHQVIMNLCTNAAQAMAEEGGTLTVGLSQIELASEDLVQHPGLRPGSYVKLSVRDTGRGIREEIGDRVFEPYFTTKETGKGTGLGLAVVHGIVESYGGAVEYQSDAGRGTTFHAYLPVTPALAPPGGSADRVLPTGTEAVLWVDDEPVLVDLGRQMLERLGYRVTTSTSSLRALQIFREAPEAFDLVISDVTMPEMTGDKLTAALLQIRRDVPVILCTGFNEKVSENEAAAVGARALATKPLTMSGLAELVRNVLDGAEPGSGARRQTDA